MSTMQCVDDDTAARHKRPDMLLRRVVRDGGQRYYPVGVGEAAGGYIRGSCMPLLGDALLAEVVAAAEADRPMHRRYSMVLLARAAAGRAGIGTGKPLGCTPRIEVLQPLVGSRP